MVLEPRTLLDQESETGVSIVKVGEEMESAGKDETANQRTERLMSTHEWLDYMNIRSRSSDGCRYYGLSREGAFP